MYPNSSERQYNPGDCDRLSTINRESILSVTDNTGNYGLGKDAHLNIAFNGEQSAVKSLILGNPATSSGKEEYCCRAKHCFH